ncbi:hypothetical protein BQ8794_320054 [Mesorhizobium prunaredense]|uniref:Uncharacterized protein n=1 Tax=Mesorhizobium prunaredense TaxID=1631249 RepID=A0A1R3VEI1_9HYPH|nr:hypothetical protein BQ8794_320054 [Mesorhizobium prunaredense]
MPHRTMWFLIRLAYAQTSGRSLGATLPIHPRRDTPSRPLHPRTRSERRQRPHMGFVQVIVSQAAACENVCPGSVARWRMSPRGIPPQMAAISQSQPEAVGPLLMRWTALLPPCGMIAGLELEERYDEQRYDDRSGYREVRVSSPRRGCGW